MSHHVETKEVMVADLRPHMNNLNVAFRVLSKGELNEVISRRDSETHYVVNAKVGDSTGAVILPL